MRTVTFKFDLNNKVKTPLGETGIVDSLGVNNSGNVYYILTKSNNNWFEERQLSLLMEDNIAG